ncbi:MAG: hypothetical protein KAS23_10380, partial [Anaerohalosphaera sp.]|nr:hypothetical protein [Anaerohalosphaera sp.]
VKASALIQQTIQGKANPYDLLDKAAAVDKLSPTALELKAKYAQQQYYQTAKTNPAILEYAVTALLEAIKRESANFKYHERLSDLYLQLAESSTGPNRETNLNNAYDQITKAIKLYPGLDRLWFDAAQIAERLNNQQATIENYSKAVEIEQAYRKLFEVMYPGRDMVSRLGEEKFKYAKEKMDQQKKQDRTQ